MERRSAPNLPLRAANAALALAVVSVLVLGALSAQSLGAEPSGFLPQLATIAVQVLAFAVPAILVCRASGLRVGPALGLHLPTGRVWLGAILIGSSFWLVNATFIAPLGLQLFGDDEALREMSKHFRGAPLGLLLLSTALTPAICEELLFRGAFARSLSTRVGPAAAIVVSSLVFALIHFPMARAVPAFATGLVLAYVALSSGSTVAAMVVHFINNAVAVALTQLGDPGSETDMATPVWLALAAAVLVVLGASLLVRPPTRAKK